MVLLDTPSSGASSPVETSFRFATPLLSHLACLTCLSQYVCDAYGLYGLVSVVDLFGAVRNSLGYECIATRQSSGFWVHRRTATDRRVVT